MATKLYRTRITVNLTAVGSPSSIIFLDGAPVTFNRTITEPTNFTIDRELSGGTHILEIHHCHKEPNDATTALVVDSITFNDITNNKFIWQGIYTPEYPEPWATEQGSTLAKELKHTGYLGWNGIWRLEFSAPIFTWIHQVADLGWIYT